MVSDSEKAVLLANLDHRRSEHAKQKPAYHTVMDLQFTAVFRRVPEGYIAFVEELPGANTQGATLEEARANLQEAVTLVLEANRCPAWQIGLS